MSTTPLPESIAKERDAFVERLLAPLVQMVVGAVRPTHQVLKACRSGRGVPYPYYGADFREGQAAMNRAMFLRQLGAEWLSSMSKSCPSTTSFSGFTA